MPKKAKVKFRSLRTNLVHLPLSLYASLTQQQTRPQTILLHLEPLTSSSSRAASAYIGWSGLASASSLARGVGGEETVEVDPEVAMSLGWSEGMLVEVGIINSPTKAGSVNVTPVSEDDWEILEQHASFLENNLLMQMRSATKGRTYDVWVHRTKIQIRVDETDPRTSEKSAVLLHPGTEIYVAPRIRKAPAEVESGPQDVGQGRRDKGKGKDKSVGMRLVPGRIAGRWGQPPTAVSEGLGELERVFFTSEDSMGKARRRLGVEDKEGVYVRMARKPRLPVDGHAQGKMEEPKGDQKGDDEEEEEEGLEGWLFVWEQMPDGHCVVAGPAVEGWDEWTNVRLSLATPPKGRLKGAKKKDPASLAWSLLPPASLLPVLLSPVDEGVSYCQRSRFGGASRRLLITGGKGSGKTSIVKTIAAQLEADVEFCCEPIYEDVARVDVEGRLKETKARLEGWLDNARNRRPAVLILDGLDSLLGPENELTPSSVPTILAEMFCRLLSRPIEGVFVIATASSMSSLHPLINAKHIFGEVIKVAPLTKERRRDVIKQLVNFEISGNPQERLSLGTPTILNDSEGPELDHVTLASTTEGYSISDLKDLVHAATQQAVIRGLKDRTPRTEVEVEMEDFVQAHAAFTPVSLRGVTLQKSSVAWSDIGGLHEPRRILRETLEWPTKYAQIFASCPLRLRSGLLLYGYPGCGKTLLASAVAKECGLNFISVKGPEILNKYIGASEKSVRDLFERASAAKPCILFFDEFDSIAPKRGHDSTGVTDRVVNQMLTEMDGAQGLDGVYVLAATSRPDLIDSALLRPGRLDKSVLCDMPSEHERQDILRAISRKLTFGPDVDLTDLAGRTRGFSGADLQALVYNAHLDVVHTSITSLSKPTQPNGGLKAKGKRCTQVAPKEVEEMSTAQRSAMEERIESIVSNTTRSDPGQVKTADDRPVPVIEQRHLLLSLSNTRPSVSPADFARLQKIYSSFSSDRDGTMANGDMGRETGTRTSLM